MKLDITSIIKDIGASLDISVNQELEAFKTGLGTVNFIGPALFIGVLTNNDGMLTLNGKAKAAYETVCDRCGKKLDRELTVDVFEELVEGGHVSDQEEDEEFQNDRYTFSGHIIILDQIIADNLILNIPMQHLCSDDCQGLCPVCGTVKSECSCSCDQPEGVDPRLASLKDFFKE